MKELGQSIPQTDGFPISPVCTLVASFFNRPQWAEPGARQRKERSKVKASEREEGRGQSRTTNQTYRVLLWAGSPTASRLRVPPRARGTGLRRASWEELRLESGGRRRGPENLRRTAQLGVTAARSSASGCSREYLRVWANETSFKPPSFSPNSGLIQHSHLKHAQHKLQHEENTDKQSSP